MVKVKYYAYTAAAVLLLLAVSGCSLNGSP